MPEDDLLQFRVKPKRKKERKQLGKGFNPVHLNIGFYLLIPILLGVFIGYKLDQWIETKPLFTILFLVLGVVSSFYNLWKLSKEQS